MRHWIGRSDARALLLLAGLCVGSPVAAHRRLAVGFEGATVAALPSGDVTVWAEPAKLRAKHAFGPDLVSLAASPAAPLVAVLRRTAAGVVLERWNWTTDAVDTAPAEVARGAVDVVYTRRGHALLVAARDALLVLDAASLARRRSLTAPGLGAGPCDLAVAPADYHFAAATDSALWLGPSEGAELRRTEVALATGGAPRLEFTPDGATCVAVSAKGLVTVALAGGLPRAVPLEVPGGVAADLSSDSQFVFVAVAEKVHMLQLADGRARFSGVARPTQAEPLGLVTNSRFGAVAVLYADGQMVWYQPLTRQVTAAWPPLPSMFPSPGGPGGDKLQAVQTLMADPQVFEQVAQPLDLFVLDKDYERLAPVEEAARQHGWSALVMALLAARLQQPDRVPEPLRPLAAQLATVDLVHFKNVQPRPELVTARLEAVLGPAQSTLTTRMTPDGRILPLYRFGPFGLVVDAGRLVPGAGVITSANLLQSYVGGS